MAMKETVGSLRTYFIITGLLSGGINSLLIAHSMANLTVVGLAGIGVLLSLAFLYLGVRLPTLLVESPNVINTVILANMGFIALTFAIICAYSDPQTMGSELVKHGIYFAICFYLLTNAKRLSAEEIEKLHPQPPAEAVK